jgi:hypothetical protein
MYVVIGIIWIIATFRLVVGVQVFQRTCFLILTDMEATGSF